MAFRCRVCTKLGSVWAEAVEISRLGLAVPRWQAGLFPGSACPCRRAPVFVLSRGGGPAVTLGRIWERGVSPLAMLRKRREGVGRAGPTWRLTSRAKRRVGPVRCGVPPLTRLVARGCVVPAPLPHKEALTTKEDASAEPGFSSARATPPPSPSFILPMLDAGWPPGTRVGLNITR